MQIRLIAVDLDGTLLNSQREISEVNRQALAEAAARGISIVITTGRRYHSAKPFVDSISCLSAIIASNGALIGTARGEIVRRRFLAQEIARRALEAASDFRQYAVAIYDVAGRGQVMLENCASTDGPLGWYVTSCPDCIEQVDNLASSLPGDPVQIMLGGPPSKLEPLETVLRHSSVGSEVQLTWTKYLTRNVSLLDVLQRGCSKGEALRWLAERASIARQEVMAIGDNFNDLEMLEFAGWPVVMENCAEGFACDGWHRTASSDHDGVAAAIRSWALA